MTRREDKARLADVKALLVEDGDFTLRPLVQVVLQEMLGAEMTEALEAEQGERTPTHLGYRAGYFPSTLVTRVGRAGAPRDAGPLRPVLDRAVRALPAQRVERALHG